MTKTVIASGSEAIFNHMQTMELTKRLLRDFAPRNDVLPIVSQSVGIHDLFMRADGLYHKPVLIFPELYAYKSAL